MRSHVALLDMDGSVADYDGGLKVYFDKMRSPNDPDLDHLPDGNPPWLEARRQVVSRLPGFWRNLSPLPNGFRIVRALEEVGFDIHVLTKGPSTKSQAWAEKLDWCREHLPNASVSITERKDLTYGRVLVDDWMPYGLSWLRHRPRGVLIVPAQRWNVGCESLDPQRIFRYDGIVDDADLVNVLRAVKSRRDEESVQLGALISPGHISRNR